MSLDNTHSVSEVERPVASRYSQFIGASILAISSLVSNGCSSSVSDVPSDSVSVAAPKNSEIQMDSGIPKTREEYYQSEKVWRELMSRESLMLHEELPKIKLSLISLLKANNPAAVKKVEAEIRVLEGLCADMRHGYWLKYGVFPLGFCE